MTANAGTVPTRKIRESPGDRVFLVWTYALIILIMLCILFPLLYVLSASVSDPKLVVSGKISFFPRGFQVEAYRRVFQNSEIWIGYRNSILYTVVGTFINISLTLMGAYPLSRNNFRYRNIFMAVITFTMFFSGGLIPSYLLITGMGMHNTMWALIIPTAVSVYNLIVARTFMQNTINGQLYEAAYIDGCNNSRAFFSVTLPLCAPIIAVLVLFYAVNHWNSYFEAMIYMRDRVKYPLQLFLREILVINNSDNAMVDSMEMDISKYLIAESVKYAVIIVSSAPILILYPFLQKYFAKGMMIGAIKG